MQPEEARCQPILLFMSSTHHCVKRSTERASALGKRLVGALALSDVLEGIAIGGLSAWQALGGRTYRPTRSFEDTNRGAVFRQIGPISAPVCG